MEINEKTTGIEGIELLPTELLIDVLTYKADQLDDVLQGFYMLRLQNLTGLKLHREIGALIDKSPSYVSLRIRKAKENLIFETKGRGRGRRSYENYDMDKIVGDDIPIRIQSKIGTIPTKNLADYLKSLANEINEHKDELVWKELYADQVDSKKSTKGRKRYMQLIPDLDQEGFLKQRYPLRLISKEGELDQFMLVEYLEEAAVRLYAKAQDETYKIG